MAKIYYILKNINKNLLLFIILVLNFINLGYSQTNTKVLHQYDALNRLIQVVNPDGTLITYEYDEVGNRTKKLSFNALPDDAGVITGTTPVCQSQNNVTYTVPLIANADEYLWTIPTGASGSSITNSIAVSFSSSAVSGNITVRGVNAYGQGNSSYLYITVNPVYNETDATTICNGDTYVFGNQNLTITGNYTETFQTVNGCDSTVVLTLTVNPVFNETDAATICDGDTYVFGNQNIIIAGNYTETFQTVNGCDSTVVLTLTVNPVFNETDAATICDGDTYVFGTQNLTIAGNYTETFQTVNGCDSTVVLTLTVYPVYNETDAATICDGDTYVFGTQNLTIAGNYTETFQTVNSCDSTVVLTLTINPIPATPTITQNGNILTSDAPMGNQWHNQIGLINGATNQNYTVTVDGNYYVIVSLNGCSSNYSNIITVTVTGIEVVDAGRIIKVYPNPVSNELIIEIESNNDILNFEILNMLGQIVYKGSVVEKTIVQTNSFATGVYLIKLENGKTFEFKKIIKQ